MSDVTQGWDTYQRIADRAAERRGQVWSNADDIEQCRKEWERMVDEITLFRMRFRESGASQDDLHEIDMVLACSQDFLAHIGRMVGKNA